MVDITETSYKRFKADLKIGTDKIKQVVDFWEHYKKMFKENDLKLTRIEFDEKKAVSFYAQTR